MDEKQRWGRKMSTRQNALVLLAAMLFTARGAIAAEPRATIVLDAKSSFPTAAGYHVLHAMASYGDKTFPIAFGIFLPKSYFDSKDPFPMVITLHNVVDAVGGSDGNDGLIAEGLAMHMVKD